MHREQSVVLQAKSMDRLGPTAPNGEIGSSQSLRLMLVQGKKQTN